MALPDIDTVLTWRGRTIVDESGEKIGKFEEVYLDTQTDQPEWAAVKTGMFGRKQLLVPLSEAQEQDEKTLRVPFAKAHVEGAPDVDADGELSQQEEARLYSHYGIAYSQEGSDTGLPRSEAQGQGQQPQQPQQSGAPSGGSQQAAGGGDAQQVAPMPGEPQHGGEAGTQQGTPGAAESQRQAGGAGQGDVVETFDVEQKPRERVRLKKYRVTEEVTKTVPVQREEIRVEREPVEGDER